MIQSSKFINDPSNVVSHSIQAFICMNDSLTQLPGTQVVTLKEVNKQVHLITGGGSGHEPAHLGFVGQNMLTAAVCGNVFSSPPSQHVYEAIKYASQGGNSILVIIKNYTGDNLNFGLAIQKALSQGIIVKALTVRDDIAFIYEGNSPPELLEARRGLTGTVLLYKILGGGASYGLDLDSLYNLGIQINEQLFTIGVSLSSCSQPGQAQNFEIQKGMMEIGMGIHGERGCKSVQLQTSGQLISNLLGMFKMFVKENDEVVILLNNLGSTTDLEMFQLQLDLIKQSKNLGWKLLYFISGKVMTSMEMHGISVTILNLANLKEKDNIFWFLQQETNCKAWQGLQIKSNPKIEEEVVLAQNKSQFEGTSIPIWLRKKILNLCQKLKEEEEYLNYCDSVVGDGDLGVSVKNGCKALIVLLLVQKVVGFSIVAEELIKSMGGSIGPLLGSFIFGLDDTLKGEYDVQDLWIKGFAVGLSRLKGLGGANLGDRTMVDVIEPTVIKLQSDPNTSLNDIVTLVNNLCQEVRMLPAKKGRSRYMSGKEINQAEPGCELFLKIVQNLRDFP